MPTLNTPWLRSSDRAATTLTMHRPARPNWARPLAKLALCFMGILIFSHVAAIAQNLGTAPVFGRAVQGQQATTVEGTVLNVVNWGCNVIGPISGIACLGMAAWHYKSGRGYGGWLGSGVGLMAISGIGRMVEGFITQAGAV